MRSTINLKEGVTLHVDGIIEIEDSTYINWAVSVVNQNTYVSHEVKFSDLTLVTTEHGVLAVKAKSQTVMAGFVANMHKIKNAHLFED